MNVLFGPAGNSPLFYETGGKSSAEVPAWLKKVGLNAYEYQCGRGVRIKEETAGEIGEAAQKEGIAVSLHAPYYINFAAAEAEGREKSKQHLLKAMRAAAWMGASPVVFHPGGVGRVSRAEALNTAMSALEEVLGLAAREGLSDILVAAETMGKRNQLGNLEEVIALCGVSPQVIPTIDFAHLHAVSGGGLSKREHFEEIVEQVEKGLPGRTAMRLHVHFSPIEYTGGGEKRHRKLEDEGFGPDFLPLAQVLKERKLDATIICESDGKQAEDALAYREIYLSI